MAKTLGDKAAKQIAGAIRRVGQLPPNDTGGVTGRRNPVFEQCCYGKIDGTLAPNGTATLSIYKPGTAGGVGTDTGANIVVIDNGKLDITLPSSTICDVNYMRGAWVVVGYKCT